MRDQDGWFVFAGTAHPVVWSLDYDGASDVHATRVPRGVPSVQFGKPWPRVLKTETLPRRTPDPRRVHDFWKTLEYASGSKRPASLIMSGSARVVYQTPGKFEQDGISHVDMQDEGLRAHGYGPTVRVDRHAHTLNYNASDVVIDNFDMVARAKMDIVRKQIQYAKRKLRVTSLLFVFVDDIYASVLAKMFAAKPSLLPQGVRIHLVHFESFRDRSVDLSHTREIIPGVFFSPY